MSETTLPPPPQWTPATPAPPTPPAPAKVPFHARVVRIWWAIGVALACLVVGAGTGSLVTHLADHHGSAARFERFPGGFGRNGFPGQRFRFGGPNGFPGQQGQGQGQQFQGPSQQQAPGQGAPNVVPPNGNGS